MKWNLRKLPHLRKVIYEDCLSLQLVNSLEASRVNIRIRNFDVNS